MFDKQTRRFCLKTANEEANKTRMVVVFIPPAVEPGDAPISISKIIIASPVSLIEDNSAELNPAVLVVMD